MEVMTKAALSPSRRRLVELLQDSNYGRIEGLEVREGEPILDPLPTVLQLFVFGKDNGSNESRGNDCFALRKKVTELFDVFDRERSLLIQELIIDNGLPVRMTVAGVTRA